MIISLFTFQLFRDFVPLIKFDGNTEPVMVNIQGSDTNQMAGEERIELSIMVLETTVIPLNYSPTEKQPKYFRA